MWNIEVVIMQCDGYSIFSRTSLSKCLLNIPLDQNTDPYLIIAYGGYIPTVSVIWEYISYYLTSILTTSSAPRPAPSAHSPQHPWLKGGEIPALPSRLTSSL
jgi:hypothetical protein